MGVIFNYTVLFKKDPKKILLVKRSCMEAILIANSKQYRIFFLRSSVIVISVCYVIYTCNMHIACFSVFTIIPVGTKIHQCRFYAYTCVIKLVSIKSMMHVHT